MRRVPLMLVLLLIVVARGVSAQREAGELPELQRLEPGSCPDCTARVERVTIVGSPSDAELLTDLGLLFPLRNGEKVAIQRQGAALPILHYDRNGHYLGTIGIVGDGPGEIRVAKALASARGDSITGLGDGRLNVLDLASGRGRSVRVPRLKSRAFRMFVRPDGGTVIQSIDEQTPAFVLLDTDGSTIREFGPSPGVTIAGRHMVDPVGKARAIAQSPPGGFWSLAINYSHRIEQWNDHGDLVKAITRPVTWFPPYDSMVVQRNEGLDIGQAPPLPRGSSIWVGTDHRVYALTIVPDAHWHRDPAAPAAGSPRTADLTGGAARYLDVVLEVYDDGTGELIGSWRADGPMGWFGEDGLLYHETKDPDGVRVFQVWRLVVSRY